MGKILESWRQVLLFISELSSKDFWAPINSVTSTSAQHFWKIKWNRKVEEHPGGLRNAASPGAPFGHSSRGKAKLWVQLWYELLKFKAGCLWFWGISSKENSFSGTALEWGFCNVPIYRLDLHIHFEVYYAQVSLMHLEALHNIFFLYIAHWGVIRVLWT